jgi:SAM-dependent methyltransferase
MAGCSSSRGPDVIFLPSAADVVTRMLALARVDSTDVVYDLGCGDGRIVIAAAKQHGARGVCVDINPSLIAASQRNADTAGVRGRIEFRQVDLFETDLSTASVVALYLSPALNERLRPKLFREVKPGSRIVSHNFGMGDWRPDTTVRVAWPAGTTSTVYAWVMPADVAGNWELTMQSAAGDSRYHVRFAQQYQELSGTASNRGRQVTVTAARLHGDRIEFQLAESRGDRRGILRFAGRVSPTTMEGVMRAPGDSDGESWKAVRR